MCLWQAWRGLELGSRRKSLWARSRLAPGVLSLLRAVVHFGPVLFAVSNGMAPVLNSFVRGWYRFLIPLSGRWVFLAAFYSRFRAGDATFEFSCPWRRLILARFIRGGEPKKGQIGLHIWPKIGQNLARNLCQPGHFLAKKAPKRGPLKGLPMVPLVTV